MRNKLFVVVLVLGLIILSACAVQKTNEPTPTPEPTPETTPVPTPTPEPLEQIAVSELPEGDFLLHELYPEKVTKIELEVSSGYDKIIITVDDEQKISELLEALDDVEVTDVYDPLFLEGEVDVCLSMYDGDTKLISIEEDSSYVELIVENIKYKKKYAVKDEKIRKKTAMISLLDTMFENYVLTLNNGMYNIDFVPLHVQKDGYTMTSELGLYAWPVFNFETIDFSGYTLFINENEITELPKEPGEYILVVENSIGKYQIKIFVD